MDYVLCVVSLIYDTKIKKIDNHGPIRFRFLKIFVVTGLRRYT